MSGARSPTSSRARSRLRSLAEVIQEVDSAPDMETALRLVATRTRELMGADVCSIYFSQPDRRRHVVVATDGLASTMIGHLELGFGEGLVGRVAENASPINVARVPEALEQEFLRQSNAGHYRAFLGVPVTHRTQVLGVLVVRQRVARRFDDTDAATLTTLAAQLGGAIAYARASGMLCTLCTPDGTEPRLLEGVARAPGIAAGIAVVVFPPGDLRAVPNREVEDPLGEALKFRHALARVNDEIKSVREQLGGKLSSIERTLFDAYALILSSREITEETIQRIHRGHWAPGALRQTLVPFIERFEAMEDPYLRQRSADIRDLGNRILTHLRDDSIALRDFPNDTILVGRQLSAIDLGLVPHRHLRGIVSGEGSGLTHVAILARTLGIPAVMGIDRTPLERLEGQEIVIDGDRGQIHLRPSARLRQTLESQMAEARARQVTLAPFQKLAARTKDGLEVAIHTNVGITAEPPSRIAAGAAGIGLFRSELPFMLFDRFPSEDEQVEMYRRVLESVAPRPVNLRTLDIGGDKPLPYLPISEPNPALGWRGIRFTLDHPEIFLTQLRAALRANMGLGNLRLLLPMVDGVADVDQALALIGQAHRQLQQEGVRSARVPVGLMIEVPSAVYLVDELSRRVDFLSVGTNDLAQYILAVDRTNPAVSRRLDPLHPALLRALHQLVKAAARLGQPLSVCGEMAADPACALLLIGLGITNLSVSPAAVPQLKQAIRSVEWRRLQALGRHALTLDSAETIRRLVDQVLADAGLGNLPHQQRSAVFDSNVAERTTTPTVRHVDR